MIRVSSYTGVYLLELHGNAKLSAKVMRQTLPRKILFTEGRKNESELFNSI